MDTRAINKQRQDLSKLSEIWVFGYGSLIYKVDFPFLGSQTAVLRGWSRRFWQASHDHRGTPDAPGRVLTLIEQPGVDCFGVAYQVTEAVFDHLDEREKNGYLRHLCQITLADGREVEALVYIGDMLSPTFVGPEPEHHTAEVIKRSHGPSGSNIDYVYRLADALRAHGEVDAYVFAVEQSVRALDN